MDIVDENATTSTPQYTVNVVALDPLWVLLGILIVARLLKKKSH